MIIINSMTTPLKRLLYSKYKERDTYTENPRKLSISTNEKVKATSYLEKVRAFYVMWVKKTVWFLTFFDNVSFCVDFLVEWSSRGWRPNRDTDTEPHKKYQQLPKDRKAKEAGNSNWVDVLSLHLSSIQFNSQLFKHLEGNETKHCQTVKAIFITSTFLNGSSHIPLCLSQIFLVTLYNNHH